MTPEAQRIAIACGWTGIEDRSEGLMMPPGFSVWGYPPVNPLVGHKEQLPRFLDDLNAMHAALKAQTQALRAEFDRRLHAMAEEKHLLITELAAKDWADCFISCLP